MAKFCARAAAYRAGDYWALDRREGVEIAVTLRSAADERQQVGKRLCTAQQHRVDRKRGGPSPSFLVSYTARPCRLAACGFG